MPIQRELLSYSYFPKGEINAVCQNKGMVQWGVVISGSQIQCREVLGSHLIWKICLPL